MTPNNGRLADDPGELPDDYHGLTWMCGGCGAYVESEWHCPDCGAEPPWGCDCSDCDGRRYSRYYPDDSEAWISFDEAGYPI